jgi:hypothetical protein
MDLVSYTPHWLLRSMSDAALAFLWAMPSAIGLVVYATVAFTIVDKLFDAADHLLNKTLSRKTYTNDPIGAMPTRLKFLLIRIPTWVLKTVVGLPMLHVVNLVMSKNARDIQSLTALCSGAHWQLGVLHQLPKQTWLPFTSQSQVVYWLQFTLVATFLIFTFWYSARAFDLVRRIRKAGDLLLSQMTDTTTTTRDLPHALAILQTRGWTLTQCRAAAWFLMMVNVRILMRNVAYDQFQPKYYGIQRVVSQLAVASGLSFLNPVAGGLYVAFELKQATGLLRLASLFDTRFSELPAEVQRDVSVAYPKQE